SRPLAGAPHPRPSPPRERVAAEAPVAPPEVAVTPVAEPAAGAEVSFVGRVVDRVSSLPVEGAIVECVLPGFRPRRATTDREGLFTVGPVAADGAVRDLLVTDLRYRELREKTVAASAGSAESPYIV